MKWLWKQIQLKLQVSCSKAFNYVCLSAIKFTTGFWSYKSARLYLTLTCSLAIMANGFMRNTLNMAMVCMVKLNPNVTALHTNASETCLSSATEENKYQVQTQLYIFQYIKYSSFILGLIQLGQLWTRIAIFCFILWWPEYFYTSWVDGGSLQSETACNNWCCSFYCVLHTMPYSGT